MFYLGSFGNVFVFPEQIHQSRACWVNQADLGLILCLSLPSSQSYSASLNITFREVHREVMSPGAVFSSQHRCIHFKREVATHHHGIENCSTISEHLWRACCVPGAGPSTLLVLLHLILIIFPRSRSTIFLFHC